MGITLPRLAEDLDTRDGAGVPLSRAQRVAANAAQAKAGGACWGRAGKVNAKRDSWRPPEEASAWPGGTPCQLSAAATALDAQCFSESGTRDSSLVPGAGRAPEGRVRARQPAEECALRPCALRAVGDCGELAGNCPWC